MTYINAVKYIEARRDGTPSPERMRLLCRYLGEPEKQSRFILVTGSNGKSSTAEMIRTVLTGSGYKVGSYVTSYEKELKETVLTDGVPASYKNFAEYVEKVAQAAAQMKADIDSARFESDEESKHPKITKNLLEGKISPDPVASEILCAAAFIAFRHGKCDISILECGNSRADPTGVIDPPLLTVICGSSFTDEQLRTCVGSVRRGTKEVVGSSSHGKIYDEISSACSKCGSRFTVPAFGELSTADKRMRGRTVDYRGRSYFIPSPAGYYLSNALTAIEALYALKRVGMVIHGSGITAGIEKTKIPLRFEILSYSPAIILDCPGDVTAMNSFADALTDAGISNETGVMLITSDPSVSDILTGKGYRILSVFTPATEAEDKKTAAESLRSGKSVFVVGDRQFTGRIKEQILRLLAYT